MGSDSELEKGKEGRTNVCVQMLRWIHQETVNTLERNRTCVYASVYLKHSQIVGINLCDL